MLGMVASKSLMVNPDSLPTAQDLARELGAPGAESKPIGAALAEIRERWPDVRLDTSTFARHAAEHVAPRPLNQEELSRVCADELYLACACARGDRAALALLEERYLARLPRSLSRISSSPAFADEVLQQLRQKLLAWDGERPPRIATYAGRGPLMAWLRAAAVRTALNLRAARPPEPVVDAEIERDLISSAADPEQALMKHQLRAHFRQAVDQAFSALRPAERNLRRLPLVEGLSIDRLAVMFQIHRATAARRLERARARLREVARLRLADGAGLRESELDSALRLIRSEAEANLSPLTD
jgi:RNA polymerase sigma-70 factor (ECF subfamily)